MRESIDALFSMKKAVVIIKQPKPYIFNYFNISGHYVTIRSGISRVARLLNPFIHGLNEEAVLPKIIVIIPDADMLQYLVAKGSKVSSLVIGSTLHYAIMQFNLYIERGKQDLASKHLGALLPDDAYPKIVWVGIPKRPKTVAKEIFANRGQFNTILEERLFDGKASSHFIISIEIPQDEFTLTGELSSAGKTSFWREINEALKKFDLEQITLKPRQWIQSNQDGGRNAENIGRCGRMSQAVMLHLHHQSLNLIATTAAVLVIIVHKINIDAVKDPTVLASSDVTGHIATETTIVTIMIMTIIHQVILTHADVNFQ